MITKMYINKQSPQNLLKMLKSKIAYNNFHKLQVFLKEIIKYDCFNSFLINFKITKCQAIWKFVPLVKSIILRALQFYTYLFIQQKFYSVNEPFMILERYLKFIAAMKFSSFIIIPKLFWRTLQYKETQVQQMRISIV